jgi:hypothetical protein
MTQGLHCKKQVSDILVPNRDVTTQTIHGLVSADPVDHKHKRDSNYNRNPYTVKKRLAIFPARESLVSDIPAGDGNIANLFYSAGVNVLVALSSVFVI